MYQPVLGIEDEYQRRASRDKCQHKNQGSGGVTLTQDILLPREVRVAGASEPCLSGHVQGRSSLRRPEPYRLFEDSGQERKTLCMKNFRLVSSPNANKL